MHRVIPSILFGLVIGLLFVAVLFATGCRKNVYNTQSFEGAVCAHLQQVLGQKVEGMQDSCVRMIIATEQNAEAHNEGEKYHEYLECVLAAPTYHDALYCRKLTGWDAN